MVFDNGILHIGGFISVTLGIVVLFVGKRVNNTFRFLKEFSIPEPVTGGLTGLEYHFRISHLVSLPISISLICEEGILAYSLYRFAFFVRYSPVESSPASFAFSKMASLSSTRA